MRYFNKIYGRLSFILLSVFILSSCSEEIDVNGSGNDYSTINGNYGFVRNAAGASPLQNINIYGTTPASAQVYYELAKSKATETTVTFSMSQDVLDAYNAANKTTYSMYPSNLVVFEGAGTIPANSTKSNNVTMNIQPNTDVEEGTVLAIPVTVTGTDVEKTSEYIYLVTVNSKIPSTDKGVGNKQVLYVEVNNESLLNAGEYRMKNSGAYFFDMVYIFAANINFNTTTGKMYVNCNENVQYILDNADRIIRPLQAKGIKVGLSILGNHDGTGIANLTDEAAAEFAKELKLYVDTYGLDGINFDDEWSDYGNYPIRPGITTAKSSERYARLVYETRKALGDDKIISIYEIGDTPNNLTPAIDGVYTKDIVDYCYYPYYSYYSYSFSSYIGVPNSQYFGLAIDLQDVSYKLNESFVVNVTKNNNHAGIMYYNLKSENAERTAGLLNTVVGTHLIGDEVVWSGVKYSKTDLK